MVAYSFNPRFVAPILSGSKRQTIRAPRKRHAHAGEALQLYTGMRTRHCRLIGRATCLFIDSITIDAARGRIFTGVGDPLHRHISLDVFAREDGFDDWTDFRAFFTHAHPEAPVFAGVIVRWTDFAAA